MTLDSPVVNIKGIGPAIAEKLSRLGLHTVGDLIFNLPRKYNDYSNLTKLANIEPGEVSVKVRVDSTKSRYVRRGLHITEAILADNSGKIKAVWFNQPYRENLLKSSDEFYMAGRFDMQQNRFVLQNPVVEKVKDFAKNTARIIPIYRETQGLKSSQIRQFILEALPLIKKLPENLPPEIVKHQKLMPRNEAIFQLHFPDSLNALGEAKTRYAFEEIFELLLAARLNKDEQQSLKSWQAPFCENTAKNFIQGLKFNLTNAQRKAAWEILKDLEKEIPMNRLLQGDVGSGKTVVAAMAAQMANNHDLQVALLAPTEVLAAQHAETISQIIDAEIALLVGSTKNNTKTLIKERLSNGEINIAIGTHALIQDGIDFKKLGLIIIDEQHRFGVKQRNELLSKNKKMPHILSMTATPIPRSLALTVYGELSISIINEKPPGRVPIQTEFRSPHSRDSLYKEVDTQIETGRQVYIICPLVSESDKLGFKSAQSEYEHLKQTIFKHRRIGLIHGKLSSKEKDSVMQDFKNHKLDILVSTTVIEVGVDIPNASIMLIEGADRFGLAQLHQLRGRVGRGKHQSYCYLIPSTAQKPSRRLQELTRSNDGFYLAEVDLDIRGPGEIYGLRQHGALNFKVAQITDTPLINRTQEAVDNFMKTSPNLLQYKELSKRVDKLRRITTLN